MERMSVEKDGGFHTAPGWVPDPETLRVLGDLAGVAWFQVDGARNVVAMSPAMEALTGISPEQALGRPCIYLSRCHECLRTCGVFDHGRVSGHHLTLYDQDGGELPVAKSGQVILDDAGKIIGAVEVVTPLTSGEVGECDDREASEAARIAMALKETRYNRTEAARQLGISRTTLWRKMREFGL